MTSRTLIVNPIEDQKNAYLTCNDALDLCIKSLVVGEPIKNAYLKTKEFIVSKDASYANKIHSSFGFGVMLPFANPCHLDRFPVQRRHSDDQ